MTSTRRDFLTTTAAAAGALTLRIPTASATTTGSCFFNIDSDANLDSFYNAYIDGGTSGGKTYPGLVHELGRNFAGIRKNYGPDNTPTISPEITYAIQHGRKWVYQNGKPNPIAPDTNTSGTFWRSIANGRYDAVFNHFFAASAASGLYTNTNPLHYSPHHEQTALAEPPAAAGAGTATDFQAMFRHVHDLCVAGGYHVSVGGPIALCLVPDVNQVQHDPKYGTGTPSSSSKPYQISLMDPGPTYYDYAGMDCYQKTTNTINPTAVFTALHKWALAVGKPFMTGEMGVASTKNPAGWIAALDKTLKGFGAGTGPGQCYALCWTSRVAKGGDFRMDASSTILAAYKTMAADPFYGAVV